MRILQVVKTNEGANWAFSQAKWLFEQGIDIITVLPSLEGGMAEQYKKSNMKVVQNDFSLPLKSPWKIFQKIREIRGMVKELNPDLIHCHFVTNVLMVRIALKGMAIPRLFQVPGPLHLEHTFFRKLEIGFSDNNDYWAGACIFSCNQYLREGISKDRVFLAYYSGYDGKTTELYPQNQYILHQEYNLSKEALLVGMVSYFYKPKRYLFQKKGLKGHEDFIDAIALVRAQYPNVIGVIIGGPWGNSEVYVKRVKTYAEKRCPFGILFTGFRKDIKQIYRELSIAVHPSHTENLGGAAESLAALVPTIATETGGFPDIVFDGKTGYLVPKKSPRDLSVAIIKMIENPKQAQNMAAMGRKKVISMLDINSTAGKILDIYEVILKEQVKKRNYKASSR